MYSRWILLALFGSCLSLVRLAPADEPAPKAFIDGTGLGWTALGEPDFVAVNGEPGTWTWKDGEVHCTGLPVGVTRSQKKFTNLELVVEWRHLKSAGNSGVFLWASEESLKDLKPGELPRGGIEVQVLDHGYAEAYEKKNGKKSDWFTTNGDVFPVGSSTMTPFPPAAPDGKRSFPRKNLSKGVGEWNHYYVRAIDGEVRLWVNGEEVSGGTGCEPRTGYLCLESEGSPVEFRNLRIRELPNGNGEKTTVRKPFGIEKRELWTTSKVHGTPEPPDPYKPEPAFPKLKFDEPLAMTVVPGTNRLVVAERKGKIWSFVNDPATDKKDLLVDVGRNVYGVALHPNFAENGYVFTASILDAMNPSEDGSRLSRFTAKPGDVPQADAKSEEVILIWPSGGHNGGCLRFGPDGYLYLATGDGSGIADSLLTGQDLTDLLGCILRLNVDRADLGRKYSIPKDNPFVSREKTRPEIYSYGHRQVWKFSFDPPTKRLWAGEVGQDLWEMVYLIEMGGNYGWSVNEGNYPFRPERPKGPTPFIKPVVEHAHADFRSITGGWVYHAERLPELKGAYIYGDYDTGRIWSLRYDEGRVTENIELADTIYRIVEIGQDPAGDVYFVDFISGGLYRLAKAPPPSADAPQFPRKLSETGLFASTKDNRPAKGLIPYSVNSALWSDHALKERFIALPGDSKIEYDVVVYPQPAPGSTPGWRFPDEAVIVKTFSLEMEAGNPKSARRLETRILHHKRMPGTDEVGEQFWRGYTYIWNDEQTDAELADARGADKEFVVADPQAPGGRRKQVYHFPSRAECTLCHTMAAKYVLGLNTLQMNKDHDYNGVVANQIATLDHLGVFDRKLPDPPEKLPKLVDYTDTQHDLNLRVRSYLHSNCSHCHRKWGGGNAEFQLLATLPLTETGTIDVRPGQGLFELKDPKLVVPGEPERSMIHHRTLKTGLGRMPHVASNVVDQKAVEMLREWIAKMPQSGDAQRTGLPSP